VCVSCVCVCVSRCAIFLVLGWASGKKRILILVATRAWLPDLFRRSSLTGRLPPSRWPPPPGRPSWRPLPASIVEFCEERELRTLLLPLRCRLSRAGGVTMRKIPTNLEEMTPLISPRSDRVKLFLRQLAAAGYSHDSKRSVLFLSVEFPQMPQPSARRVARLVATAPPHPRSRSPGAALALRRPGAWYR